ncbi:hypothetical protein [Ferruginibacter sp. SUN106]|uniref:hypothetical protein n=1 Tax=Ferruginibacter sp. SUN106 TaxID=2978348 RepID=UPI003D36C47F
MKLVVNILFLLFSFESIAQDCTREIAQSVPTILEKGFDKKTYEVKDAYGKKLGDNCYPIFANAIQQSKGLHGNFSITTANEYFPGLSGYNVYAYMFYVYCTKEHKLEWKGLSGLNFKAFSNVIRDDIGNELRDDQLGTGSDHFVYLDNNIIYTLQPHKPGAEINGYPFIEAVNSNVNNAVLITKKGTPFFTAVTRRQYLALMRKNAALSLAVQKKMLAESIQQKLGMENAITSVIDYSLNDIKQIDAFIAGHNAEYLNKPCITIHKLESLNGKSFAADAPYFFDVTGQGNEWVIVNPSYINKKLPASVPQFFSITWSQGEKEVEKKAALLFKQTFDFKKMEAILQ